MSRVTLAGQQLRRAKSSNKATAATTGEAAAQAAWLGPTTTKARDGGSSLIRQGQGKSWIFAEHGAGKNWTPARGKKDGKNWERWGALLCDGQIQGNFAGTSWTRSFCFTGTGLGGSRRGAGEAQGLHLAPSGDPGAPNSSGPSGWPVDGQWTFGVSVAPVAPVAPQPWKRLVRGTGFGGRPDRSMAPSSLIDFARSLGARDP